MDDPNNYFRQNRCVEHILKKYQFFSCLECFDNNIAKRTAIASTPCVEIRPDHQRQWMAIKHPRFRFSFCSSINVYWGNRVDFIHQ